MNIFEKLFKIKNEMYFNIFHGYCSWPHLSGMAMALCYKYWTGY